MFGSALYYRQRAVFASLRALFHYYIGVYDAFCKYIHAIRYRIISAAMNTKYDHQKMHLASASYRLIDMIFLDTK